MGTHDKLHIGRLIRAVFDGSGMSIAAFARQINRERTTIYDIFERDNIDVQLLVTISRVLKHNFFADIERHHSLAVTKQGGLTLHIDHLSREAETALASLLTAQTPPKP